MRFPAEENVKAIAYRLPSYSSMALLRIAGIGLALSSHEARFPRPVATSANYRFRGSPYVPQSIKTRLKLSK